MLSGPCGAYMFKPTLCNIDLSNEPLPSVTILSEHHFPLHSILLSKHCHCKQLSHLASNMLQKKVALHVQELLLHVTSSSLPLHVLLTSSSLPSHFLLSSYHVLSFHSLEPSAGCSEVETQHCICRYSAKVEPNSFLNPRSSSVCCSYLSGKEFRPSSQPTLSTMDLRRIAVAGSWDMQSTLVKKTRWERCGGSVARMRNSSA